MPNYLTPKDVAKMLNVHVATIIRWCKRNLMPYTKIERQYRFDETAIHNWIADKTHMDTGWRS